MFRYENIIYMRTTYAVPMYALTMGSDYLSFSMGLSNEMTGFMALSGSERTILLTVFSDFVPVE